MSQLSPASSISLLIYHAYIYKLISVKGVKRRSKIARANRRSYRYTIFKSSHHISPPDALGTTGDVFQNKEDKVFLFLENGWEPHNEAPESDPTQLQRFPDDYDLVCRQRTGTWHTMTFLRNANNVNLCGVKAEEYISHLLVGPVD